MKITHAEIIDLWPSMRVLADEINENLPKVNQWKARNSIPSKFWVELVSLAQDRDIAITYKMLAEAAAQ
ncbi:hypothetical protein KA005_31780 [bacterium]|nr:hypothetical protein [bacterium]